MKGLILAGGRGTRLRPLTHTHAKQLIPVGNKPILFYGLEALAEAGIREVGIIVGDTQKEIEAAVGDGSSWGIKVTYIKQDEPLGLAHAVKVAQPFLKDSPFVLYLGDNLLLNGIKPFVEAFRSGKPQALILLTPVNNPSLFGVAEIREDGKVVNLEEKPCDPKSNLALVGVYIFQEDIFLAIEGLKPSWRGEYEITHAIQRLLDQGKTVLPFTVSGWWKDTGRPEDLLEANTIILDQIKGDVKGEIVESSVQGRVVVEKGAKITESTVRGPAVIGSGVFIKGSFIGPYTSLACGVRIINTEIAGSIVMADSCLQDVQPRIEDSIIGQNALVNTISTLPRSLKLTLGDHCRVELQKVDYY